MPRSPAIPQHGTADGCTWRAQRDAMFMKAASMPIFLLLQGTCTAIFSFTCTPQNMVTCKRTPHAHLLNYSRIDLGLASSMNCPCDTGQHQCNRPCIRLLPACNTVQTNAVECACISSRIRYTITASSYLAFNSERTKTK